jgi:hypothetical protein
LGSTLCPGYENRNCVWNNGEVCTNTGVSTRKVLSYSVLDQRTYKESENIPFNAFWDPVYCQNGIMAQRCDGYTKVDPRAGFKGFPPNWINYTIVDLFPALSDLIKKMTDIVESLLSGTEKQGDSVTQFIDLIQKKIDVLQKFINNIQNVIGIINDTFSGPGFYLLLVPPNVGGNDYIDTSIKNAKNGPSSDAFGYTSGVVIVVGGPDVDKLWRALTLLF